MKVLSKVICMETIKPSSPTPKPLREHLLSYIDREVVPTYNPVVYFYPSNSIIPSSDKSKRLKKSLSEVLSRFYPLAGNLVGNHYVNCNDAGLPFFEAESNCDLSHVVPNRNHEILEKFLPHSAVVDRRDLCLAIQTTYFRCGGLALGILLSHKVADGFSTFMFANSWAAAARGGGARLPPLKLDAADYFPPRQETSGQSDATYVEEKEELATRIITFPAAAISLLRERYSGGGLRPSRVEALSTFLWTQFMSATGGRSDPSKVYVVCHPVNIRSRVDPPLSDNHFGNILGTSKVVVAAEDDGVEVVRRIRDSVKAVNNASGMVDSMDVGEKELVFFSISSTCGYPIHEADFGWGRPVRVGLGRFPFKNVVFLMDEQSGGGIEALVHLTKQDMLKFEAHLELHMPLVKE